MPWWKCSSRCLGRKIEKDRASMGRGHICPLSWDKPVPASCSQTWKPVILATVWTCWLAGMPSLHQTCTCSRGRGLPWQLHPLISVILCFHSIFLDAQAEAWGHTVRSLKVLGLIHKWVVWGIFCQVLLKKQKETQQNTQQLAFKTCRLRSLKNIFPVVKKTMFKSFLACQVGICLYYRPAFQTSRKCIFWRCWSVKFEKPKNIQSMRNRCETQIPVDAGSAGLFSLPVLPQAQGGPLLKLSGFLAPWLQMA